MQKHLATHRTWNYGCATVHRHTLSGVLLLEAHGLVTDSTLASLCCDLRQAAAHFPCYGVVLDFHLAVLLGLDLARLLLPQHTSRLDQMPLALLVKAEDRPSFLGVCDWAAECGRVSAIFTDLSRACAWARARGRVLAALRE
jgi:hypothetical protein